MSLKAWAGLLGEFGRQSEAYASRQQELEDKRMEEERENRRLQALLAKEQALETWRANRPLSEREQAVFDEDLQGKKARRAYEESRAQYYSGGVDQVQALAEQIAEEQGISVEEALPLAQARIPTAGRRGSSAGGKSAGTAGALKLGNADLVKDEKDEQTGKTFKRYLNGAKVPDYSEDEFVQIATERANAWRKQKGKGLMNAEPSEEDTSAFMAEQLKALKEANAAQHKAAFEESKRVFSEFNAQPGLVAPQGKTGQGAGDRDGSTPTAIKDASSLAPVPRNNYGNLRPVGKSTGFQEFATPEEGLKALEDNLISYGKKGVNTPRAIINRWSPPNENDTESLVSRFAKNTGFGPDQKIDLNDPETRQKAVVAIILQEHGKQAFKVDAVTDGKPGEPTKAAATPGKMPQEWVNGVLSRADREREASKQQSQKKGLLADPPPSPFGGFEAAAGAGMTPDEEAKGGESFGTTVGKAARSVKDTAGAVKDAAGATYDKAMGLRWGDIFDSLSAAMKASVAEAQKRQGVNDQMLEMMYAEQAKKGVPVEQFIKDFITGYSGK